MNALAQLSKGLGVPLLAWAGFGLGAALVAGCSGSSPGSSGSSATTGASSSGSTAGSGASGAIDASTAITDSGNSSGASAGTASGGSTGSSGASGAGHVDAGVASDGGHGAESGSATDGGAEPYKGLASYNGCTDIAALKLSWYYDWEATTSCASAAQFVPQIWGHSGENVTGEMAAAFKAGYTTVVGFNEPDNTTQSNISVANAIAMWPELTSNPAIRIGSPATQANTTGQAWFTSFMDQVNADTTGTLRVDFITIHWYGWNAGSCESNAATLEGYLKWAEAIPGNRPIWLTEWACSNDSDPTAQVVQTFLTGAIAMFAKHPRLERYGWFTSRSGDNNGLITNDAGVLTPLGVIYAAAPSTH